MSYFVGLDVSLRSVALCIVNADGDIVLERALDCEVEAIDGYLRKFGKPVAKLGFEAGVMSQMLFHGLQALGYDVVCMEARQVNAAVSAMRNKTDKNDARCSPAGRPFCANVSLWRMEYAACSRPSVYASRQLWRITALTIQCLTSAPMRQI